MCSVNRKPLGNEFYVKGFLHVCMYVGCIQLALCCVVETMCLLCDQSALPPVGHGFYRNVGYWKKLYYTAVHIHTYVHHMFICMPLCMSVCMCARMDVSFSAFTFIEVWSNENWSLMNAQVWKQFCFYCLFLVLSICSKYHLFIRIFLNQTDRQSEYFLKWLLKFRGKSGRQHIFSVFV